MGLLDWLFRRKPAAPGPVESSPPGADREPARPGTPGTNPPPCPHCRIVTRQTRADGRCVCCGNPLPDELRAPPDPAPPPDRPPRPVNVRRLAENSPLVCFEQGGVMVLMDEDAFDYLYGEATGPDPAQRDLDALLPRMTRVCVLEGALFRGRALTSPVLLDVRDPQAIGGLAACLRIVEDPQTFGHCQCLGGPTMELYAGPEHLATLGVQHGRAIRWKQWHHDAQLQDGERLSRWLQEQGVKPAHLQAIYERGNNFLLAEPAALSGPQQEARRRIAEAQDRAQAGDLAEARRLCEQALALDPELVEGYALRAQVCFHLGRLADAAADCSAAIDRGFRHAETYFIRAVALDGAERCEEALADCAMALHLDPQHAGAYDSRGLTRGRLGRLDEAVADFSEAIRLAPGWFLPYLHRAQTHRGGGRLDAALADFDRAIDLATEVLAPPAAPEGAPMLAQMYCARGDARYDQFREEEAEADFAEGERLHPDAAAGYLGDLWLRRSKFELAVSAFSRLVNLRPDDARGYTGRGMCREGLGELEEAVADYTEAIRLQPEGGVAYALRARVRQRQGRTEDAVVDLSHHLRHHPGDPTAYLSRSALHKQRGELEQALEDLNAAHRVAPEHPLVCNNLAWMLATCADDRRRDGRRALALARQACEATGWRHPFCLGTLGAACAETGAFDEAARWQAEALDLYPEEEKAAGRARLELYQAGKPYRE